MPARPRRGQAPAQLTTERLIEQMAPQEQERLLLLLRHGVGTTVSPRIPRRAGGPA
ncbi:hypothetical protein BKA18_006109 [Streptomyces auratus]